MRKKKLASCGTRTRVFWMSTPDALTIRLSKHPLIEAKSFFPLFERSNAEFLMFNLRDTGLNAYKYLKLYNHLHYTNICKHTITIRHNNNPRSTHALYSHYWWQNSGVKRRSGVPQPHFRTACRGQDALQCTTELRPWHPPPAPLPRSLPHASSVSSYACSKCLLSFLSHTSEVFADVRIYL